MGNQHETLSDYQDLLKDSFDQMSEISSGGGGIIIKAHHKGLDKEVIIKKVIRSKVNSIGKTGERDVLKNLKHAYLPQIYDYFEYGDDVFTVMEFIPGENFAQLVARKTQFRMKDIIKWTCQLCDVVNYLHSKQPAIIHCDIKPANIMLTPEGNICLIDFNISNVKGGDGLNAIGYTPGYAPAEQFFFSVSNKPVSLNTSYNSVGGSSSGDTTQIDEDTLGDITQIDSEIYDDATQIDQSDVDDLTEVENVPAQYANHSFVNVQTQHSEGWTADKVISFIQSNGIKNQIDEKTDIYSIGATLYFISTGIKPSPFYEKSTNVQELNPKIPDGLVYFIHKAMSLKPQDRFSDCGTMLKIASQIHKVDKAYKRLGRLEAVLVFFCGVIIASGILVSERGFRLMQDEKASHYNDIISEMSDARESGDYDEVDILFARAIELNPSGSDAYYEKGMTLFQSGQYENCIEFITDEVLNNSAVAEMDIRGTFYYIIANCYFELEDYRFAADYYSKAIKKNSGNAAYYRDYVISLARLGDIAGAEKGLDDAKKAGATEDTLLLLEGEIKYADLKYDEAQSCLQECILTSDDEDVLLRAYAKLDDVLVETMEGNAQYETRVEFLEKSLSELSPENRIILMERLAQVYMDYADNGGGNEYNDKALDTFDQIRLAGYGTFQTDYNTAVLYEKLGRYNDAIDWSLKMIEERGENYRWYKRLSFVELQRQNEFENTKRDYRQFQNYYEKTVELYKENSNGNDSEMLVLDNLYSDLVDMGWLD